MWHHEWPTRPAPAAYLAKLVPSKLEEKEGDYQSLRDEKRGYNACIAAILRNIEEAPFILRDHNISEDEARSIIENRGTATAAAPEVE